MDRKGTALLSLTTIRSPDTSRGTDLIHVDVQLPPNIAQEIASAESGARAPLSPKEAANLLWNTPAASYLDGRRDAWLNVPGVRLLVPGMAKLLNTDADHWPKNQAELKKFLATAAPGNPSVQAWMAELIRAQTLSLLNDLLIIFKYAATGRRRPLDKVAGLFRLLTTATIENGPSSLDEVKAWLSAPLVVPRAFVAMPGLAPARPAPDGGGRPGPRLPPVSFDTDSGREILRRVDEEIEKLERGARLTVLTDALHAEGIRDPAVITRLTRALDGNVSPRPTAATVDVGQPMTAVAPPSRRQSEIVRTYLGGHPVLVDLAEFARRTTLYRQSIAEHVLAAMPAALRDRIVRLGIAIDSLPIWPEVMAHAAQSPSYLEPSGRSDLLLVRQVTTGYRRSEIAYLENILVGETRFREHTQRITTRREVFEQEVREQEETHDLQVTDRAELSREINDVVKEDLKAEGSIQVTSRGPTKVVASASVGFNRSTEEAAKVAEEYSRETVERAIKRTLEKITREVRTAIEQEVVELNRHSFERDSNATEHLSGIYQYLERVSRARIFCYGERELYDLLIPEPAALIWQLAVTRTELHNPLERPDAELFKSLTIANIAEKREEVIRAFRVTDMPDLPEDRKTVSMPIRATGSGDGAKHSDAKDLQIPEGYAAVGGWFGITAEVESDIEPNGGWVAGTLVSQWIIKDLTDNSGQTAEDFTFVTPQPGPSITVAFNADNFNTLSGAITIYLELTQKAKTEWALEAYGRVSERYEQLRREYEQTVIQLAATQQAETTNLPEGSRLKLQQMVRFELQRAAIDVMRNAPVDFGLMTNHPFTNPDGTLGTHPVIDVAALMEAEPEIRFLQQAFEWEHMTWILYPYFWGRRGQWSRTVVQTHPDPDFAGFLNAGAARVQISVRPGFENAVKHFMETGEVYEGGELPKIGDPTYVTFIDEQMTSLGAPGEEVPWPPENPKQWDVYAPTPLVLARQLAMSQLPSWDPETGEETQPQS